MIEIELGLWYRNRIDGRVSLYVMCVCLCRHAANGIELKCCDWFALRTVLCFVCQGHK